MKCNSDIEKGGFEVLTQEYVRSLTRDKDIMCDKNDNGRALLVAGSHCMAGAAVMAARACLRSGVGVLSVHVPRLCTGIIQTLVPEAVVSEDENDEFFSHAKDVSRYDAVGVGPGLRCNECTSSGLESLLQGSQKPLAIDADAINILSERKSLLYLLPKGSVLTPHKRELERLVGGCSGDDAVIAGAGELAAKYGIYIIAKGPHTRILTPEGCNYVNLAANAGMAKGGSGDVLSGVLLALLAQAYTSRDAALISVFVHSLAGRMAARDKGIIGMNASDIIDRLPEAWMSLMLKK